MPPPPPTFLHLGTVPLAVLVCLLAAAILIPLWRARHRVGWEIATYFFILIPLLGTGLILWQARRSGSAFMGIFYVIAMLILAVGAMGGLLGIVEFVFMRLLSLSRLGAIARITYYEALLQPFTYIILFAGIATIGVTARLGFFTYNEDFKMYRDVASSFVFLFSLPIMVFASTKVIDEEIENRTMLTLMSKPVSRTQVVLGKYLGVLMLILVAVGILGIMAGACSYMRYYDDNLIDYNIARNSGNPAEFVRLDLENTKAMLALLPSLVLTFLQVATLAAISVAVSTRFGLAVNVTAVVIIYLAASLARYVGAAPELHPAVRGIIGFLSYLLPGLGALDINQRLVFSNFNLSADVGSNVPTYGLIWKYVGTACVYSIFYIAAILSFGIALFRSRELT